MWHSKFLRLQRLNKFQNKCIQFGSKGTFSYCQHYKLILKADSHCLLAFLYINANKAPKTKSVNFFCSIFSLPSAASAAYLQQVYEVAQLNKNMLLLTQEFTSSILW